ncbi:MAG: heavy-metal-associated domain-containing protein [Saprospirales bacterium]|nr:MAG: heavy-metal-associated domain-containing protein [Saprospirales bacterium]
MGTKLRSAQVSILQHLSNQLKMRHQYKVTGMTCSGCVRQLTQILKSYPGVTKVDVDLNSGSASIEMEEHISTEKLNDHLSAKSHYSLSDQLPEQISESSSLTTETESNSKWQTYKPLILIAGFLIMVSTITSLEGSQIDWSKWMHSFMAGFFLTFSFFKFLDLRGFADSYSTYDILAKNFRPYGFIYPFLELGLGLAYLSGIFLMETYIFTIILMGFSSIGVIKAVFNKNTIRCACLGVVFNLPMSTVTIIENGLMIIMAAGMLLSSMPG